MKRKRKTAVGGENGGTHRNRTDADGAAGTDGGMQGGAGEMR